MALEGRDGLPPAVVPKVEGVVVRDVHDVEPRPCQRRGVLRRRLKAEATPAVGSALREPADRQGSHQIPDREIRARHVASDILEQASPVFGREPKREPRVMSPAHAIEISTPFPLACSPPVPGSAALLRPAPKTVDTTTARTAAHPARRAPRAIRRCIHPPPGQGGRQRVHRSSGRARDLLVRTAAMRSLRCTAPLGSVLPGSWSPFLWRSSRRSAGLASPHDEVLAVGVGMWLGTHVLVAATNDACPGAEANSLCCARAPASVDVDPSEAPVGRHQRQAGRRAREAPLGTRSPAIGLLHLTTGQALDARDGDANAQRSEARFRQAPAQHLLSADGRARCLRCRNRRSTSHTSTPR